MQRLYYGSKNFVLNSIQKEFVERSIVQIDDIKQLNSISKFFDNDKIFLYINPNNEEIKIIENHLSKNIGYNFLYFDDDNFDARLSLIKKIKSANEIHAFELPVMGDILGLKRLLLSYLKNKNLKINSDCIDWLINNCPLYRTKSKTLKRDIIYYDLDILFNELDKISSYKFIIELDDFIESSFRQDDDIFQFIDFLIDGKISDTINAFDKLSNTIGSQSVIMIFLYQLFYLLNLSGIREDKINDFNTIVNKLEMKDLLGKYLDHNWESTSFAIKSQNPTRVRISLSKPNISSEKLSKIFQITVDTLLDMRNNGDTNLSSFLMLNRITNV